ncbi:esterase-like activity of phytase family protein [Sphingobium sufflavum]|uniref:esterase-like activity of phytase family protein n=1 Tax=Sphingobium sufflavum TaxID=1129547 RepID=UPI001F4796A1|nr:esterase-like activity of phytase family protein [Sphingobium sufflavum]MCE7795212.1 esterase-like activity of phytase family protein [Sphingobium sufflavum]
MERIAAILVIFVLLINGRHVDTRHPAIAVPIVITAQPVPLDSHDPARRTVGALRYLGGWVLGSDHPGFGGFSSLYRAPDGLLTLLSDTGEAATFRPGTGRRPGIFRPLPIFAAEAREPNWRWDTESLAVDPVTGRRWVGFELTRRICRYAPDFTRVEQCRPHPEIQSWPETTGMESLVRLPDGRFLALAEDAPGRGEAQEDGAKDVLLFPADPVTPAGRRAVRLSYRPPPGYLPTDALWLGGGRMLVMNRRVTPFSLFTGVLTLVDVGRPHAGQRLEGRVVARLESPLLHDNYEAITLSWERGEPVLWVASDDNHLLFQRTLLLKFALPRAWVAGDGEEASRRPARRPAHPSTAPHIPGE